MIVIHSILAILIIAGVILGIRKTNKIKNIPIPLNIDFKTIIMLSIVVSIYLAPVLCLDFIYSKMFKKNEN